MSVVIEIQWGMVIIFPMVFKVIGKRTNCDVQMMITKDEYLEWKLNWPDTCDDCGRHEPMKRWRKAKNP